MVHKNRKECLQMGLNNRGSITHPDKFPDEVKKSGLASPLSGDEKSALNSAGVAETTVIDEPPPATTAAPKKKKKFSIFKKPAGEPPESESQADAAKAQPAWELSGDLTVMFWTTILSLARGAIQYGDKLIKAHEPYDTSQLEFTTSEEKMVGEVMPSITTRILKAFGVKSVEQAEAFIHGMVIIRIFGRIFISLAAHYYNELKYRSKDKKDKAKAKEAKAGDKTAEAPAPPEKPKKPPRHRVDYSRKPEEGSDGEENTQ